MIRIEDKMTENKLIMKEVWNIVHHELNEAVRMHWEMLQLQITLLEVSDDVPFPGTEQVKSCITSSVHKEKGVRTRHYIWEVVHEVAFLLLTVFLTQHFVKDNFHKALISKSGNSTDQPCSYRRIYLLETVGKIFERTIVT